MDERRNAARFPAIPALIAHPRRLAGRGTGARPAARLQSSWQFIGAAMGLVIVVGLSVALASGFIPRQATAVGASTIVPSHVGSGYPGHYGLAGPSRVGSTAASWLGYPPHFGLAGPSQVEPIAMPTGIGAGYPAHYGLAGPSDLDGGG